MRVGDGVPVAFMPESDSPLELNQISPNDPSLAEEQIQRLVFEHPSVLPIQELDDSFSPAVPVGREVATEVGPIDALYISPNGGITIAEAKLWRNPQTRPKVEGQIIDYATALSTWSYEHLDQTCERASGKSLWHLISTHDGDLPPDGEAQFIDTVPRNLRHGASCCRWSASWSGACCLVADRWCTRPPTPRLP